LSLHFVQEAAGFSTVLTSALYTIITFLLFKCLFMTRHKVPVIFN